MERDEVRGFVLTMVQVVVTTILCLITAQAGYGGVTGIVVGGSVAGAYLRGKHGV